MDELHKNISSSSSFGKPWGWIPEWAPPGSQEHLSGWYDKDGAYISEDIMTGESRDWGQRDRRFGGRKHKALIEKHKDALPGGYLTPEGEKKMPISPGRATPPPDTTVMPKVYGGRKRWKVTPREYRDTIPKMPESEAFDIVGGQRRILPDGRLTPYGEWSLSKLTDPEHAPYWTGVAPNYSAEADALATPEQYDKWVRYNKSIMRESPPVFGRPLPPPRQPTPSEQREAERQRIYGIRGK